MMAAPRLRGGGTSFNSEAHAPWTSSWSSSLVSSPGLRPGESCAGAGSVCAATSSAAWWGPWWGAGCSSVVFGIVAWGILGHLITAFVGAVIFLWLIRLVAPVRV